MFKFILGLISMPLVWVVFNILNIMYSRPNTNYISLSWLYKDFYNDYTRVKGFNL